MLISAYVKSAHLARLVDMAASESSSDHEVSALTISSPPSWRGFSWGDGGTPAAERPHDQGEAGQGDPGEGDRRPATGVPEHGGDCRTDGTADEVARHVRRVQSA